MSAATVGWYIFAFLVFPGFLFSLASGLLASWIDRKVSARVQWRAGPPLGQPLFDVIKLLGKETIVPEGAHRLAFLLAPLLGLAAITVVCTILWLANIFAVSFVGDLIVVVYLLVLPSISLMIGGFASGNPLAATGASREMKLILAYELPFLVSLAVAIIRSDLSIRLVDMAARPVAGSISGVLAFIVAVLCVQAKLGFPPFDVAEAETEIMEGVYIEYSGAPLAVFKLTQAMLLIALPVFMATVFLGGLHFSGWGILWAILKCLLVVVLVILIKNTNPRVRIDQAVRFFWRYMTPVGVLAAALALAGRAFGIPWL
jgi:NADH-quinone oxidoreductase subunit H